MFEKFFKNREYSISKDSATAIGNALTTLDSGDKLEIRLPKETIIINVMRLTIQKHAKPNIHR